MDISLPPWILWPFIIIVAFISLLYFYVTRDFDYWKKRSVPHDKPVFPFGSAWDTIAQRRSIHDVCRDITKRFEGHRYAGTLMIKEPILVVCDPDLIKRILVKDFSHFHDRGFPIDEENNPLSGNLFGLPGSRWHSLRNKLSPTFTSGKMKYMFAAVKACAEHLQKTTADEVKKCNQSIELKDLMSRFTTDVISSVAFGVDAESLENPDSEFRIIGRRMFAPTVTSALRNLAITIAPKLCQKLKIQSGDPVASEYFMRIVKEAVDYRDQNNVRREDFLQLLLGLRNTDGEASSESGLTLNQLTAQCFVFFFGGFETSAATISFCLYELSQNLDLQQRVREEVESVLDEHDGEITYDGLVEMHLMDRVIFETLRKYPPLPLLFRECTKEYVIPSCDECGTDSSKWKPETRQGGLVVEEGTKVHIPVSGLHYDPDYFPDPERFDPDRFTEEGKKTWPPFAYLPFGEGPRICIGMRFALMQTKCGLAAMLTKFEFRPNPKRPIHYYSIQVFCFPR